MWADSRGGGEGQDPNVVGNNANFNLVHVPTNTLRLKFARPWFHQNIMTVHRHDNLKNNSQNTNVMNSNLTNKAPLFPVELFLMFNWPLQAG